MLPHWAGEPAEERVEVKAGEDLAQRGGEGFRVAGLAILSAQESAVVAAEDGWWDPERVIRDDSTVREVSGQSSEPGRAHRRCNEEQHRQGAGAVARTS